MQEHAGVHVKNNSRSKTGAVRAICRGIAAKNIAGLEKSSDDGMRTGQRLKRKPRKRCGTQTSSKREIDAFDNGEGRPAKTRPENLTLRLKYEDEIRQCGVNLKFLSSNLKQRFEIKDEERQSSA